MKVVFTHTDLRIYWPARLDALNKFLNERNIDFDIIEIAGLGSPYSFAGNNGNHPSNWHCLFPLEKMEDIPYKKANRVLREKLDEIMPDIVFAGSIAFPSGAASVRWASENKRNVIIFDDSRLQDIPRSVFVNYIKRLIYSRVDAVFSPSPAWNETFNYFGFQNNQIFYGLDIVDNGFWQTRGTDFTVGLRKGYFLTVGRQIPIKNLFFLLKAYIAYANSTVRPIEIVLVGAGSEHCTLEEFVKENKLSTVHFIPFVSQENLKSLYGNASCFVLPSIRETWGLVVNEAMASGLPVLVSNKVGCSSTLVMEGINGYTFSPYNITELSRLLAKMVKLTDQQKKIMGQNSKKIIDEWGLDRFCNGVYDAILYVNEQELKKPNLLSRLILKLWKGRYRPV